MNTPSGIPGWVWDGDGFLVNESDPTTWLAMAYRLNGCFRWFIDEGEEGSTNISNVEYSDSLPAARLAAEAKVRELGLVGK